MPISFSTNDRLIHKWSTDHFVEEVLVLAGLDGVGVTVGDTGYTISGNSAAITSAYQAADTALSGALTSAFTAADSALESSLTTAFQTADSTLSGALSAGYGAADTALSGALTAAFEAADSALDATVVHKTGDETIEGIKTFTGDTNILGDLNVSGTINQLNTEQLLIEDSNLILNSTVSGTPVVDGAIKVERGTSADAQLVWNETDDRWEFGVAGSMETIASLAQLLAISGAVSGDYAAADAVLSGALTSAFEAADSALESSLTTAYQTADSTLSGALTSAFEAADSALESSLTTAFETADSTLSGALSAGYAAADTALSGALTAGYTSADTTLSGALKAYVDAQVASAAVAVEEEGSVVNASAKFFNFTTGLDVTLSTSGVVVAVDESELVNVVHLTGDESIGGTKTFTAPVVLAGGTEPAQDAAGASGELRWSDDYLYLCVASGNWKRMALAVY